MVSIDPHLSSKEGNEVYHTSKHPIQEEGNVHEDPEKGKAHQFVCP